MGSVSIDTSEIRALAADMRAIDSRLTRNIIPTAEKAGVNVKSDMREAAGRSEHFGQLARAITYEVTYPMGGIEVEIGPEKGKPGSIAGIAYFGGSGWTTRKNPGRGWQQGPGGGGTVEDPQAALDREAPKFSRSLADLAAELVFGR